MQAKTQNFWPATTDSLQAQLVSKAPIQFQRSCFSEDRIHDDYEIERSCRKSVGERTLKKCLGFIFV